jgi:hypothetical protein
MIHSFRNLFRFSSFVYSKLAGMILRNKGQAITGIILRMLPVMGGKPSRSVVRSIKLVLHSMSDIAHSQGLTGLVKYLKMVSVLTQQIIAGHKTLDTHPRISRTNSGIPRLFPVSIRIGIRKANIFYIRLALTLSSIYRDIVCPANIKLASITNPYSGKAEIINEMLKFLPNFHKTFVIPAAHGADMRRWLMGRFRYFPISKSSPQSFGLVSSHPLVMIRSALAFPLSLLEDLKVLSALSTDIRKCLQTPYHAMVMIRDNPER